MTVHILVLSDLYGDPNKKIGIDVVARGLMVFLISLKACPTILTELVIQIKIYNAAVAIPNHSVPV